jgi:exopolysaccharide biosynthesis polyprenyl glycosylphosphotransferase
MPVGEREDMSQHSALQAAKSIKEVGQPVPRTIPYAFWKRLFDIAGSIALLIVLFPLFLVIALAVKLTSKGPIFYKCQRVGLAGGPFPFIKFRSMYIDADRRLADLLGQNEKDGPIFKMKNDPRITPVGGFLRKYSLDELPQLVNVLIGQMSLVGPRPPLPREVEQYDEYMMQRLTVKPGITCFWQIMGRSDLTFQEWMDLDHRYLREMSFWTDLVILLKTPMAVLKGDGAY